MHNTYILHQTSYHLLVQVPSCATQRKNRDLKKVRGGVTVTHTTFPLLPKRSVSKGGVERIKMRGAVTEMSLYQNCNSVRNTNFQISDEQWFLEGKNKRLTCAVVGLALRGSQAVLDKCFLLPMNYPPRPSLLQPV